MANKRSAPTSLATGTYLNPKPVAPVITPGPATSPDKAYDLGLGIT